MVERLDIGPCPNGVSGVQVTDKVDYIDAMKHECRVYIKQLERVYGAEAAGVRLAISSNSHDFGTYYDVVAKFDEDDETATAKAFEMEAGCEDWDEEAEKELRTSPAWVKWNAEWAEYKQLRDQDRW